MNRVEIWPLTGIGEIPPGADLAALLRSAMQRNNLSSVDGDILVVTQVRRPRHDCTQQGSVCAGRNDAQGSALVLRESDTVLRAIPHFLIVRHRLGLVMANAGIDRSNIGSHGGDWALLLPLDPDGSAAKLASELGCAVVISDSFGRAWRLGVTAVGIGAAGLPTLLDLRGKRDRDGRLLEVTQVAIVDLVASAAALVSGEGSEGIPAVLVRGFRFEPQHIPAAALTRPIAEDLFQ